VRAALSERVNITAGECDRRLWHVVRPACRRPGYYMSAYRPRAVDTDTSRMITFQHVIGEKFSVDVGNETYRPATTSSE